MFLVYIILIVMYCIASIILGFYFSTYYEDTILLDGDITFSKLCKIFILSIICGPLGLLMFILLTIMYFIPIFLDWLCGENEYSLFTKLLNILKLI
jgi:hypothetical protein